MPYLHYKIYPLDRDITKLWSVEYVDPATGRCMKKYGKLKACTTLQEKLAETQRIIKAISRDLKLDTPNTKVSPYPNLNVPAMIQQKLDERSIGLRSKSIATYQSKVIEFVKWYRFHGQSPEVAATGIGIAFIKYLKEGNRSNTTWNNHANWFFVNFGVSRPNAVLPASSKAQNLLYHTSVV